MNSLSAALEKMAKWRFARLLLFFLAVIPGMMFVFNPPVADDFYHRVFFKGSDALYEEGIASADIHKSFVQFLTEPFRFFSESNSNFVQLQNRGYVPWWSDSDLKVSFWRPLTALGHWLDYQLWPDSLAMMRLHTLFLYAMTALLLFSVFRQMTARSSVAFLAVLLFVLDNSHLEAIIWIAGRNSLFALFWGVLALRLLQYYLTRGHWGWWVGSWIALACSLLSGEAGVASLLLLGWYGLLVDSRKIQYKWQSYVPYVVVFLIWQSAYVFMGMGAAASSFYLDPFRQTGAWFVQVLTRIPLFSAVSLTGGSFLLNGLSSVVILLTAGICLFLMLWVVLNVVPRLPEKPAVWWSLAIMLSAPIPVSAVSTFSPRLLIFVSAGSCLFLAILVIHLLDYIKLALGQKQFLVKTVLAVLIAIHIVGAAFVWAIAGGVSLFGHYSVHPRTDPVLDLLEDMAGKKVLVAQSPDVFGVMYLPFIADYHGIGLPAAFRVLLPGHRSFQIERTSHTCLRVSSDQGITLPSESLQTDALGYDPSLSWSVRSSGLFRSAATPLKIGDVISDGLFEYRIIEMRDSRHIQTIDITILDEAGFDGWVWYVRQEGEGGGYTLISPPLIGEKISINNKI